MIHQMKSSEVVIKGESHLSRDCSIDSNSHVWARATHGQVKVRVRVRVIGESESESESDR